MNIFRAPIKSMLLSMKKRSLIPQSVTIQCTIGFYLFMTTFKHGEGIEG